MLAITTMPKLCSLCSSISFLDLPPYPEWIGGYHVPIAPLSEMVPHVPKSEEGEDGKHKSVPAGSIGISYHQSLEELQAAAKECEICALIEDSALRVKSLFEEALETPRFAYYDKSEGPNYELGMTKRREGEDGVMVWSMAKKSKECYLMGAIGFCVDDGMELLYIDVLHCLTFLQRVC